MSGKKVKLFRKPRLWYLGLCMVEAHDWFPAITFSDVETWEKSSVLTVIFQCSPNGILGYPRYSLLGFLDPMKKRSINSDAQLCVSQRLKDGIHIKCHYLLEFARERVYWTVTHDCDRPGTVWSLKQFGWLYATHLPIQCAFSPGKLEQTSKIAPTMTTERPNSIPVISSADILAWYSRENKCHNHYGENLKKKYADYVSLSIPYIDK